MLRIVVLLAGSAAVALRVLFPPAKVFMAEGNRRLACSPDALSSSVLAACVDDVQLMALQIAAIVVVTAGLFVAANAFVRRRA